MRDYFSRGHLYDALGGGNEETLFNFALLLLGMERNLVHAVRVDRHPDLSSCSLVRNIGNKSEGTE